MFVDQAKICVKAGAGGRGCHSFYRDKYTRKGIPDGGDGGRGANIIIRADRNLHTLLDFKYNRHFAGAHGAHGSGNNCKGKDAADIIIRVPPGTTVKEIKTGCIIRDLVKDGEEVIAAYGGAGGLGNRKLPEATTGEPGEEKELLLDLKLIADVGVVGFPNAGKSTLISAVSGAHPKIAAYPFTTLSPVLGVVGAAKKKFVIAEVPGLIEGSSQGRGLGDKFLRHIERNKVLLHLIDISGGQGRNPIQDYKTLNQELKNYGQDLSRKPQIIAANKMDLEGSAANLAKFRKSTRKRIYPISALKNQGLEELIEAISKKL